MTSWAQLCSVAPLRDAEGTIVLEEVDDDAHSVTFRVHARRSLVATLSDGRVVYDGAPPPVLVAALELPRTSGGFAAAGGEP